MTTNNQIWTEKYRPKTLSEYYISKSQLDKVKEWLDDLKTGSENPRPFLILYGTAGVGKTTLAHLIFQKHGYEIIECNASDTRSKKQLRDLIGGISSVSVCVDSKNLFKKTAVIMDEIDGLNGVNESSGIQELIDIVITKDKTTKEIKWVCPVICTTNSIKEKKLQALIRVGVLVNIQKPSNNDILKLITRISKIEGFNINQNDKDNIIARASGDYRQVILLLQEYCNNLQVASLKSATRTTDINSYDLDNVDNLENKDNNEDKYKLEDENNQALIKNINNMGETPLDKINYFLTHNTKLDIVRYFCSGDSNLYFMNFYNNIIPVLQAIQEKKKMEINKDTLLEGYKTLIKVYKSIKNADLLNNPIFITKYWELLDYFDCFSVGIPSKIIFQDNVKSLINNKDKDNKTGKEINIDTNVKDLYVKEFNLGHHTQYNFMRQEQMLNKKLLNTDYSLTKDKNICNIYYNLKRFQNNNAEMVKKMKNKKKNNNQEEMKYVIDKPYLKILDKINELLA